MYYGLAIKLVVVAPDPRTLLLLAFVPRLDWPGSFIIGLILCLPAFTGIDLGGTFCKANCLVVFMLASSSVDGWLFGSFTVLRWRRLAFSVFFSVYFSLQPFLGWLLLLLAGS